MNDTQANQTGTQAADKRFGRRLAAIGVVVAVLLMGMAWSGVYLSERDTVRGMCATATQAWGDASTALAGVKTDADTVLGQVDADDEATGTKGYKDSATGKTLIAAIDQAMTDNGEIGADTPACTSRDDATSIKSQTETMSAQSAAIAQATEALKTDLATYQAAALAAAAKAKAMPDYTTSLASLETALANATTVLTGSDGKVMDVATRDALAAVIAAAQSVHDTNVGIVQEDTRAAADVDAAVKALNDAAVSLQAPTDAVTASQAAWQTEQERIAAEAAAAQAEAAAKAQQQNKTTSGGTKTTGGGTTTACKSGYVKNSAGKCVPKATSGGTSSSGTSSGGTSSGGTSSCNYNTGAGCTCPAGYVWASGSCKQINTNPPGSGSVDQCPAGYHPEAQGCKPN